MSESVLISAKDALDMSNGVGERLKQIQCELSNIAKSISEACMKGERSISLNGTPLHEVMTEVREQGYIMVSSTYREMVTISW